jgi:hypothetical protein
MTRRISSVILRVLLLLVQADPSHKENRNRMRKERFTSVMKLRERNNDIP